jgi:hypothetical protein
MNFVSMTSLSQVSTSLPFGQGLAPVAVAPGAISADGGLVGLHVSREREEGPRPRVARARSR